MPTSADDRARLTLRRASAAALGLALAALWWRWDHASSPARLVAALLLDGLGWVCRW